jgi:hypothetical protein
VNAQADATQREHDDDCQCLRCTGLPNGHGLSIRHGAYSKLALEPAAAEIVEELRGLMPVVSGSFEPLLELAAMAIAQSRLAHQALSDASDRSKRLALSGDARGWERLARDLLKDLGLAPKAAAELGLTLELAAGAKSRREQLAARYRSNGDGGDAS